MKIFEVSDKIKVVCEHKKTRNGFKHEATLHYNGVECDKVKICYLNRTWERYEFQSVLEKLKEKTNVLSSEDKKLFEEFIKHDYTDKSIFKTTCMVASLGEVFCETDEEKNTWKKRMLKAGINGLSFPSDWDTLPEEEKKKRLDNVIKFNIEVEKDGIRN